MKIERSELREYLLGRLPEKKADELDTRLFADDTLHRDLQDEQDLLIEDFLGGRLTEDENTSLSAHIARSPSLQEKVASFRVLLAALERQTAPVSHSVPSRISRFAILISPALAIMLCVAIYLYVREFRQNASLHAQLQALSHAPQIVSESHGNLPVAVAFLSASTVRGPSAPPQIGVSANDSLIEFELELRAAPAGVDSWDAELWRGTDVIWKASQVPLRTVGHEEFLPLFIESRILQPGDYEIRYRPSSSPHEVFRGRAFRVARQR
jgi:anti-sigma factor RsiW